MRAAIPLVSTTVALTLTLAACGGSSGGAASTTSHGQAGKSVSIGFISQAPRNDAGFTQYGLAGVKAAIAAQKGLKLSSIVDNVSNSQDQIMGLQRLAAANAVVVADGASLNKAVEAVAPRFPKVRFILVAAHTESFADNVTSVDAAVGYDAMVVGAVASALSTSKKLGMIAGLQVPASASWYYGMVQGVGLDKPGTKVVQTYTGDYNDVGKAKQAAEAMIATGVDSVLSDLDSGSQGVYQASDAAGSKVGVYQVFGLDCKAGKNIVGSGVVDWSAILKDAVTDAARGDLPAGAISYGMAKGAVSFQFCPGKDTAKAKAIADKVTREIIAGDITPADKVLLPKPPYAFAQR
ncbi:BMP family ABC transporter substrate-binding protein [Streptomyces sp. NPDC001508]|uniref:BMP family lipoprotein n=1 Tax=Streptomyces sp. NPDC001508 TaxID=3154656 RepID=UPI003316E9A4